MSTSLSKTSLLHHWSHCCRHIKARFRTTPAKCTFGSTSCIQNKTCQAKRTIRIKKNSNSKIPCVNHSHRLRVSCYFICLLTYSSGCLSEGVIRVVTSFGVNCLCHRLGNTNLRTQVWKPCDKLINRITSKIGIVKISTVSSLFVCFCNLPFSHGKKNNWSRKTALNLHLFASFPIFITYMSGMCVRIVQKQIWRLTAPSLYQKKTISGNFTLSLQLNSSNGKWNIVFALSRRRVRVDYTLRLGDTVRSQYAQCFYQVLHNSVVFLIA